MVSLKPVQDQVVVIVGASSGIGRVTAKRFAEHGARVVVAARGESGLRSLVEEIQTAGGQAVSQVADASRPEDMEALARRAMEAFNGLDTWAHIAGVSMWADFGQTTPEEFRQVIEVDLLGPVHGAMAALPHMKRNGGAFIVVSSVVGKRPLPLQSAYSAAKHGVIGFLDSLRLELQHAGLPISVTNVMPSSINTPLFEQARTKLGVQPQGLPPVYEPEEVARAILYAAEHPTRDIVAGGAGRAFITGQALSPSLLDSVLLKIGFTGQRSSHVKSPDAPDNLFGPLPGYDRAEGNLDAKSVSAYTWLRTHPKALYAVLSAALGAAVLLGRRAVRA